MDVNDKVLNQKILQMESLVNQDLSNAYKHLETIKKILSKKEISISTEKEQIAALSFLIALTNKFVYEEALNNILFDLENNPEK